MPTADSLAAAPSATSLPDLWKDTYRDQPQRLRARSSARHRDAPPPNAAPRWSRGSTRRWAPVSC